MLVQRRLVYFGLRLSNNCLWLVYSLHYSFRRAYMKIKKTNRSFGEVRKPRQQGVNLHWTEKDRINSQKIQKYVHISMNNNPHTRAGEAGNANRHSYR